MLKNIRTGFILAAGLAVTAGASFADGVILQNTTCISASCSPGTLSAGQSDSGAFNTNININGDTFSVVGNWLDTLSADGTIPQENLNVKVTLTHTAGGGGSANDDLSITDLLDKFTWPYSSSGFFEQSVFSFGGALDSHSYAESRLTVDNTQLPLLGPFYPFSTQTGNASMNVVTPDDPITLQLEDLFSFGYGSKDGAYIQEGFSSVPEPGYAIPVFVAILGLAFLRNRLRSRAV